MDACMANSNYITTTTTTRLIIMLFFTTFSHVSSFEFQVGDNKGWVVPPPNDTKTYNDWASEMRFQPHDTIRFKYKKDSVMEVREKDYKKCNATHPIFFSNTGNTIYNLDHPGLFYFISGAAGHCANGQRIIIKVMSTQDIDDHHHDSASTPSGGGGHSSSSASTLTNFYGPFLFSSGVFSLVVITTSWLVINAIN